MWGRTSIGYGGVRVSIVYGVGREGVLGFECWGVFGFLGFFAPLFRDI